MKIGIITGSHRPDSNSLKVATYTQSVLHTLDPKAKTYLLDLAEKKIPFWDEALWSAEKEHPIKDIWKPISAELKTCDGFVIVCPEWGGMAPAMLKNFFLLCSAAELAHKPGMLVSVTSGLHGGYAPLLELRISSYKNTRICYLPDYIIARNVGSLFLSSEAQSEEETYIRNRINYTLNLLLAYTKALKELRETTTFDYKNYPFGM